MTKGNPDWAWFMEENALNRPYMEAVAPRLLDLDETRLRAMDESGIEYIVNSLTCPGIERILDATEAREAAAACNDFLADKIKAHPDRFGGFASVAMHDPDAGAAELERCVRTLGFKGVLFNGFAQQGREDNLVYLDDPGCFEHSPRNDKVELRLQDYLARNVSITTSGNYSTVALHCAMEAMGTDRIMFSVDYPFENMDEAADWIETCDIGEDDRSKIAYGNAKRLLKL